MTNVITDILFDSDFIMIIQVGPKYMYVLLEVKNNHMLEKYAPS